MGLVERIDDVGKPAWIGLLFPLWVLLVSIVGLALEFRKRGDALAIPPLTTATSPSESVVVPEGDVPIDKQFRRVGV